MHYAVQPILPATNPLTDVPAGGGTTNTAGLGRDGGLDPKTAALVKVDLLQYLGRILFQDEDYVRAVRSQIKKAHTGSSWPDSIGGQHPAKDQRQVLQGSSAVSPSLQQQDMEPHRKLHWCG